MVKKTSAIVLGALIFLLAGSGWTQQKTEEIPDAPSTAQPLPPPALPTAKPPAGQGAQPDSSSSDSADEPAPKPKEAQYGPGSRLAFKSGEGNAHVQIETKSGSVSLCTKDSQGKKDSQAKRSADAATVSGCGRSPMFYKVDETEHGDRLRRFPLI